MEMEKMIASRPTPAQLMTVVEDPASLPGSAWRRVISASMTAAITQETRSRKLALALTTGLSHMAHGCVMLGDLSSIRSRRFRTTNRTTARRSVR